jgi:dCMP deaminase
LEAGRERVGMEAVLYCNTYCQFLVLSIDCSCPCLTCSVKIVQIGVTEVVYNVSYSMDTQAEDVMRAGGVKVRQFSPPQEGLIV